MSETWRPVTGFETKYEVSNLGRVRSLKNGRIIKPMPAHHGHLVISLYPNGKLRRHFIHRLVLEAFVGPCPPRHQCRHLNGNPADNRLHNLAWGTAAENAQDRIRHGKDWQAAKTECPQGHPYSGENLYEHGGRRYCRKCNTQRVTAWRIRRRNAA